MHSWIDVATVTATKNLKGGLVVRSAADLPFLLVQGMEVAFVPPQLDVPRRARVLQVQSRTSDEAVVLFDELTTAEQAFALKGCHCLVRRSDLDPEDLRDWDALNHWNGWRICEESGPELGTILEVEERPMQLCLHMAPAEPAYEGEELLIPLVDEFIVDVDEEQSLLVLRLPTGLIEAQRS